MEEWMNEWTYMAYIAKFETYIRNNKWDANIF